MTDSLPTHPASTDTGHGSVYDRVLTFLHDRDSAIAGDPPCATEIDESVRAILQITRPAPIEPGVRQELFADWIKAREDQARRGAMELIHGSPARHHVSGKEAAFREIGAAIWNSPEWFASEIARLSSNTGEG